MWVCAPQWLLREMLCFEVNQGPSLWTLPHPVPMLSAPAATAWNAKVSSITVTCEEPQAASWFPLCSIPSWVTTRPSLPIHRYYSPTFCAFTHLSGSKPAIRNPASSCSGHLIALLKSCNAKQGILCLHLRTRLINSSSNEALLSQPGNQSIISITALRLLILVIVLSTVEN